MNDEYIEEIKATYGIDPNSIGNRNRGFFIVKEIEYEEELAGAVVGDLAIKTRDGGSNPIDVDSIKLGNCIGTAEDSFDRTYRYYYYRATGE